VLCNYFRTYAEIARQQQTGFVLESATWRASPDWAEKIGYTVEELADLNRRSIELLEDIRAEYENAKTKMVISGCIGPRGDGYNPAEFMTAAEARLYHTTQANIFSETNADMITAITMTYAEEAIGLTRAAKAADMPVAISFTVETDGRLPSGQTLKDAIEQVDAATANMPAYYMINCAHPSHFAPALTAGERWVQRIRGIRANASAKSHAELDEATELDDGNPSELGAQYRNLRKTFAHFNILGGCCGTDHRHVEAIGHACLVS
jgi:S-methylmethionine-dependent homocysteine/selenocysteine methylase